MARITVAEAVNAGRASKATIWMRLVSTIGITFLVLAGWVAVAQASVSVVINISAQTMSVQDDSGTIQYNWKVSTARKGYRTPPWYIQAN